MHFYLADALNIAHKKGGGGYRFFATFEKKLRNRLVLTFEKGAKKAFLGVVFDLIFIKKCFL